MGGAEEIISLSLVLTSPEHRSLLGKKTHVQTLVILIGGRRQKDHNLSLGEFLLLSKVRKKCGTGIGAN